MDPTEEAFPRTKAGLAELIDFLRARGVVHMKFPDLELTLLPEAPAAPPEERTPTAEPPKRGKDGLTRDEQIDLYGRPLDPDV